MKKKILKTITLATALATTIPVLAACAGSTASTASAREYQKYIDDEYALYDIANTVKLPEIKDIPVTDSGASYTPEEIKEMAKTEAAEAVNDYAEYKAAETIDPAAAGDARLSVNIKTKIDGEDKPDLNITNCEATVLKDDGDNLSINVHSDKQEFWFSRTIAAGTALNNKQKNETVTLTQSEEISESVLNPEAETTQATTSEDSSTLDLESKMITKDVTYEITINDIQNKVIPEYNDDFVKTNKTSLEEDVLNTSFGSILTQEDVTISPATVAGFESMFEKVLTKVNTITTEEDHASQAMKWIAEHTEITNMEDHVKVLTDEMLPQVQQEANVYGSPETYLQLIGSDAKSLEEYVRSEAEYTINNNVSILALAKLWNITITDEEALETGDEFAKSMGLENFQAAIDLYTSYDTSTQESSSETNTNTNTETQSETTETTSANTESETIPAAMNVPVDVAATTTTATTEATTDVSTNTTNTTTSESNNLLTTLKKSIAYRTLYKKISPELLKYIKIESSSDTTETSTDNTTKNSTETSTKATQTTEETSETDTTTTTTTN